RRAIAAQRGGRERYARRGPRSARGGVQRRDAASANEPTQSIALRHDDDVGVTQRARGRDHVEEHGGREERAVGGPEGAGKTRLRPTGVAREDRDEAAVPRRGGPAGYRAPRHDAAASTARARPSLASASRMIVCASTGRIPVLATSAARSASRSSSTMTSRKSA